MTDPIRAALAELVRVIDAAKLINLSRGVELGPTAWYVKASDAMEAARLALTTGSAALAATEPAEPLDEQEREEEDQLRQRMSDLLTGVANALQGEPPLLTRWSWHDLPERAAAATALLRSARAIAQRQGAGTAWERFDASIGALGIGSVTARTYRVLPSEGAATVMPARRVCACCGGSGYED